MTDKDMTSGIKGKTKRIRKDVGYNKYPLLDGHRRSFKEQSVGGKVKFRPAVGSVGVITVLHFQAFRKLFADGILTVDDEHPSRFFLKSLDPNSLCDKYDR